jgi:membrane protein YdbS with pleckstrin-like domain
MLGERQGPDAAMVHVWALNALLLNVAAWVWMVVIIALLLTPWNPQFAISLLIASVLVAGAGSYAWAFLYHRFYHWQFVGEQMHIWRGILFRRRLTIPYMRIQNATVVQGPLLMMFGLSSVLVETAGPGPFPYGHSSMLGAHMPGVPNGEQIADGIIEAAKRSRVREGL